MHTYSKNIKICKFYLKNKCSYGNKCKYRHIGVNELNQLLVQLEDLKMENKSLRSKLQINNQRISNLNKTKYENYDVSDDSVHALEKRLYSSLFNEISSSQMITETLNNEKKSDIDFFDKISDLNEDSDLDVKTSKVYKKTRRNSNWKTNKKKETEKITQTSYNDLMELEKRLEALKIARLVDVKALENKIEMKTEQKLIKEKCRKNSAELREHNEHTEIMNIQLKYLCEAVLTDKSKLEKIENDIQKIRDEEVIENDE
jgi:hypothetical protein